MRIGTNRSAGLTTSGTATSGISITPTACTSRASFRTTSSTATEPSVVKASDLRAAAAKLNGSTFVPPSVEVGGRMIGPADFLFAALEALETGACEVTVNPRDQLGDIARYLPKMAKLASFKGTWIYDKIYEDKWTSNRLKWQFWTFRYE